MNKCLLVLIILSVFLLSACNASKIPPSDPPSQTTQPSVAIQTQAPTQPPEPIAPAVPDYSSLVTLI